MILGQMAERSKACDSSPPKFELPSSLFSHIVRCEGSNPSLFIFTFCASPHSCVKSGCAKLVSAQHSSTIRQLLLLPHASTTPLPSNLPHHLAKLHLSIALIMFHETSTGKESMHGACKVSCATPHFRLHGSGQLRRKPNIRNA